MIGRVTLKRAVVLVCAGLVAAGGLGALVLGGGLTVAGSGTGVPSAVDELPRGAERSVSWEPDAWQRDRRLEPATRVAIGSAYVRAWAAIGVHAASGSTDALGATLSGAALRTALAAPAAGAGPVWTLRHRLRLDFYALDGATVALTDVDARLVRTAGTSSVVDGAETYAVVMVLEDGYWKVQQLRRTSAATLTVGARDGGPTVVTGTVPVPGPRPVPPARATTWEPPDWAAVDVGSVADDLAPLRGLGLDTVRVPLSGAGPSPAPVAVRAVLDGATRARPAAPDAWAVADLGVRDVVGALAAHPALLAWEVDGDGGGSGTPSAVRGLAVHTARLVRELDPQHPVVLSWADAALAADPVLAGAADAVAVRSDGGTVPAPVSVAGRPCGLVTVSAGSVPGRGPAVRGTAAQARDVAVAERAAGAAGCPDTSVERLRDAAVPATGAAGAGLLTATGARKPAAAVPAGAEAPPVTIGDVARTPFWASVVAGVALAGTVTGLVRRRRSRSGRDAPA